MLGLMSTSDILPSAASATRECHYDIGIKSLAGAFGKNEDYCAVSTVDGGERLILAIADGIGGEPHGRTVSRLACLSLLAQMSSGSNVEEAFASGLQEVRSFLREAGSPKSGASLMAAECSSQHLRLAFTGDCRAAMIRNSTLLWLNQPDRHPGTNRLLSAAGGDMITRPHVVEANLPDGSTLAFMTDGIFDTLGDKIIADIADTTSPSDATDRLVHKARQASTDDATVAIVKLL